MKTKLLLLLALISFNFQLYTLADSARVKIPAGEFNQVNALAPEITNVINTVISMQSVAITTR